METAALRRRILAWYDRSRRQLPWRENRDPYRIWISEIMLQQTRVQAVIPYYERFLRRFPTMAALAGADEQELLACWSGLGYYSRARNLQAAARVIVSRHGGEFPREPEQALGLPGIGAYTAAAVLSIAYDVPLPVLDGNVARVISRLFAIAADAGTGPGKQILLRQAATLLSPKRPGDFNQAMMELGALCCLPKDPQCHRCPARTSCRAFTSEQVQKYPPRRRKPKSVLRRFTAALILDGSGRCLLVRRPAAAQWMKGFWELPMTEETGAGRRPENAKPAPGSGIRLGALLGRVRHTITCNRICVAVFHATLTRRPKPDIEKWVPLPDIERVPVTTITRKALQIAQRGGLAPR